MREQRPQTLVSSDQPDTELHIHGKETVREVKQSEAQLDQLCTQTAGKRVKVKVVRGKTGDT